MSTIKIVYGCTNAEFVTFEIKKISSPNNIFSIGKMFSQLYINSCKFSVLTELTFKHQSDIYFIKFTIDSGDDMGQYIFDAFLCRRDAYVKCISLTNLHNNFRVSILHVKNTDNNYSVVSDLDITEY